MVATVNLPTFATYLCVCVCEGHWCWFKPKKVCHRRCFPEDDGVRTENPLVLSDIGRKALLILPHQFGIGFFACPKKIIQIPSINFVSSRPGYVLLSGDMPYSHRVQRRPWPQPRPRSDSKNLQGHRPWPQGFSCALRLAGDGGRVPQGNLISGKNIFSRNVLDSGFGEAVKHCTFAIFCQCKCMVIESLPQK